MIADGFAPIADAIRTILTIALFAAVIVSIGAAALGSRRNTARQRRAIAMLFGFLVGVGSAVSTGWLLLDYADSFVGLVFGPVVGGGLAYGITRLIASGQSAKNNVAKK